MNLKNKNGTFDVGKFQINSEWEVTARKMVTTSSHPTEMRHSPTGSMTHEELRTGIARSIVGPNNMRTYHKSYKGNFIVSHVRESLDFPKGKAFAWIAALIVVAGMIRLAEFLSY